ncbi:MAG: class A beta-lactamase [Verrucomicrobiaceae bacterium]|nr:class A beta-lactamase [Verrucomicrobiaceae bacterium]
MTIVQNLSKRNFIAASLGALLIAPNLSGCANRNIRDFAALFAEIEKTHGGRLGVCVLNTKTSETINYRGDSLFALCSTFKLPLAAIILREIENGRLDAEKEIPIVQNGLRIISPMVREKLAGGKMRIIDLAHEIQTTSDNIAANALLELIGGPQKFTQIMREMGDNVTNIERIEPKMNLVLPGETRDTTSPNAIAHTVQKILFGGFLKPVSIQTLADWMIETKTGSKRIRAGLPKDWQAGDKTGTGIDAEMPNRYNDIAVVWPPNKAPYIIAAFYEGPGYFDDMRDIDLEVLAKVGRVATEVIMSS